MGKTFFINNAHGQQLCAGLPAYTALRTAQKICDERDENVTLYSSADDGIEIEPTPIVVELDGPCGPRITYGSQSIERVELEVPAGYEVDWSSQVDLHTAPHRVAHYAAPLVAVVDPAEIAVDLLLERADDALDQVNATAARTAQFAQRGRDMCADLISARAGVDHPDEDIRELISAAYTAVRALWLAGRRVEELRRAAQRVVKELRADWARGGER